MFYFLLQTTQTSQGWEPCLLLSISSPDPWVLLENISIKVTLTTYSIHCITHTTKNLGHKILNTHNSKECIQPSIFVLSFCKHWTFSNYIITMNSHTNLLTPNLNRGLKYQNNLVVWSHCLCQQGKFSRFNGGKRFGSYSIRNCY